VPGDGHRKGQTMTSAREPDVGAGLGGSGKMLIRHATIITMDPQLGNLARGDILIEGDRIVRIAPEIECEVPAIDASDRIVIPGFCDPHIHAWEGALSRLIPNNMSSVAEDTGKHEESPDRTRSYIHVLHHRFAPLYTPEDIYIGTLVTLLAALNGGITTVCDNMHNARSVAHSEAAIRALTDSGVRGVHAYGRPRVGTWEGVFPEHAPYLRETYFPSDDQLTTMRLYLLGRDEPAELERIIRARRELDLWLSFDSGFQFLPMEQLYADGRFDGRETFNHANFLSQAQREAVRDGGGRVNVCPRIESQFRFGRIPYAEWTRIGVYPGISNDNPATYGVDMFAEMRTLYAHERAERHRDGEVPPLSPTLREMLHAATVRGADNCGLGDKVGSLAPGKKADLVVINADSVQLTPVNNVLASVVQAADIGLVDTVIVGGRIVKWRGRLVGVDLDRIRAEAERSRDGLLRRADWPLDAVDFSD
jgi:cytosine/adenosine deaminase-related metal-dependent hydrolase